MAERTTRLLLLSGCGLLVGAAAVPAPELRSSITHNEITWAFAAEVASGVFVTGDPWVIGPVSVIGISNTLHSPGYTPKPGQNGSMINPKGKGGEGYDSGAASYRAELNAGRPNGRELSPSNPLQLNAGESLVSMVSWLYRDKDDREPGCPRWYATGTPRPAVRSGAVLTCLADVPPTGSFRPAYCGDDKAVRFRFAALKADLLRTLPPVKPLPSLEQLEKRMSRTWFDEQPGWSGAVFHPSRNMPNYGRDMGHILNETALMLHLDFGQLPGKPLKDRLLINLVQFGIDLTGVADTGGSWPPDGGHALGRKWPILFAGVMLDDDHMKGVGQWQTMFQEDATTFYVSQREVDITNSPVWKPDRRTPTVPYAKDDIGLPEWGIRHATEPNRDNGHWDAIYRQINNGVFPGFVLAARLMGQQEAWNHEALFDYADRVMAKDGGGSRGTNSLTPFCKAMWEAYGNDL